MPLDPGWSLLLDEQFSTLDSSRWHAHDNDTFGAPTRVQRYMAANAVTGSASSGATGGTSLKMRSKRESIGGNSFTAAMLDTQTAAVYYPRYLRLETRVKIPHGQGLWPAIWLTAKNGGATMVEVDVMEYFHSQVPGQITSTLHRTNNAGTYQANVNKTSKFFEAPTYTPGWHVLACEIVPSAGADPTQPHSSVQFTTYIDGAVWWTYTDTSASYWTTNGGDAGSFYNIYLQGCQIDGNFVGSPDGALGYSHWTGQCLIGGTPPGACTTTHSGYSILRPGAAGSTASMTDPATTLEFDYVRIWTWAPGGTGTGGGVGPAVFTLDPVDGLSDVDTVDPVVGTPVPELGYSGLFPVDGRSAVTVIVRLPHVLALDPIDGSTTISLKVTPDLADAPPISMGFHARCFAILLPPVQDL